MVLHPAFQRTGDRGVGDSRLVPLPGKRGCRFCSRDRAGHLLVERFDSSLPRRTPPGLDGARNSFACEHETGDEEHQEVRVRMSHF